MNTTEIETKNSASAEKVKRPYAKRNGGKDSPKRPLIPVLSGLTSGEERKLKLSGATVSLIEEKISAHSAAPSDAIFLATMAAMGRKKTQLPVLSQASEIGVQLPPAFWEFLDGKVKESGADYDSVIKSYLDLI